MNLDFEILQYYINKKIVKKKEADTILEECTKRDVPVREYMLMKEYITEAGELEALSDYYNIPCIEMDMLDIDKEIFGKFSFEFMKKHKVVPVSIDKNGVLLVAIGRILDSATLSAVSICFDNPVDFVLTAPTQIDRYIDAAAAVITTSTALNDLNAEKDSELFADRAESLNAVFTNEEGVVNNPAVRLVDSIIKEAIPYRASDIHIEPFEKRVRVRYRIDGDLQERADFPIESYSAICARIKILSGMNIAERRTPQDGRINMRVGGKEFDFRVSAIPTIYGEKFVIRILDKTSFHFTRPDLGFTERENSFIDRMLMKPHGIILLTGPTGSGKTTTLYSFLKEVNNPSVNIITVEDPVEYTMTGINQTQVNTKISMTFATALRSILRQDPDIIMIGEIRDEETAEIAVRAAITGHLVFSTLHTNDAPGAITRLEDMGVPDYLISDALAGVIAQRLVKRLCPACKKRGKANAKEMEILGLDEPISIFRPQGCQFCNNTGYKGRIGVHEVMLMNEHMKNEVTRNKNPESLKEMAIKNGMVPLWDSCREIVISGITSVQELMTLNQE
ncbi:MAG: type II/IV secretion system protein [Clostridia bacterium]|nr:type II/IV secretion system protein [Clostridia bacterium]